MAPTRRLIVAVDLGTSRVDAKSAAPDGAHNYQLGVFFRWNVGLGHITLIPANERAIAMSKDPVYEIRGLKPLIPLLDTSESEAQQVEAMCENLKKDNAQPWCSVFDTDDKNEREVDRVDVSDFWVDGSDVKLQLHHIDSGTYETQSLKTLLLRCYDKIIAKVLDNDSIGLCDPLGKSCPYTLCQFSFEHLRPPRCPSQLLIYIYKTPRSGTALLVLLLG
jgi:hypothetical protein